jgi:UDP-2,3-diacylglucosamine pyrophosphatase LpxH
MIEVVWIKGNHDGPAEIISHLIGVNFLEEYELIIKDKKILLLHGDRFDNFIAERPILTKLADNFYRLVQRIDKSFYLAKLLKKGSKTFLHCSEQIQNKDKSWEEMSKTYFSTDRKHPDRHAHRVLRDYLYPEFSHRF